MNNEILEQVVNEIIEDLTELLIKQDFIDREKGKDTYVKKTQIYKDMIKWFKQEWKIN